MNEKITAWRAGLGPGMQPDEYDSKQLVKSYGIRTPDGVRISPSDSIDLENL